MVYQPHVCTCALLRYIWGDTLFGTLYILADLDLLAVVAKKFSLTIFKGFFSDSKECMRIVFSAKKILEKCLIAPSTIRFEWSLTAKEHFLMSMKKFLLLIR